jgi:AcrR family transcriptional regulator
MSSSGGKRDVIRAQAQRLFAERGVDAVSVRDIAAACGMAPPNLYAHFRSKDDLVGDLFREGYADYARQMRAVLAEPGTFRERLARIVALACRLHDEDHARFRFLIMVQHGQLAAVARDESSPVEVIARALAEVMIAGEIPPRDPNLAAAVVIGLIVQPATFMLYRRLEGGMVPLASELSELCWRALS